MKKIILTFLLLFVNKVIFSQTQTAVDLCFAIQQNFNQFNSNKEATDALNRILYVTGATPNFVVMECDKINNAVAVTYKGERYILYDSNFLSIISRNTTSWSNTFILAHEVGHHINGHTKDIALASMLTTQQLVEQRKEELEADYYAGFVLSRLGASLSQATAAVNIISSNDDDRFSTHPDKNKRIEAITRGWNNGASRRNNSNNNSRNTNTKKTVAYSAWSQYKSPRDNPFNKELSYAYTIGNVIPADPNFSELKPKLIVTDKDPENFEVRDLLISDLNYKAPAEISVIMTEVKEYVQGNYGKYWGDIKQSSGVDFQWVITEKIRNDFETNKNFLTQEIESYMKKTYFDVDDFGSYIEYEAVFDNENKYFKIFAQEFDSNFFNDSGEVDLFVRDSRNNVSNQEFIDLIKSKTKLYIRPVKANSYFFMPGGSYEYEINGRKFKINYNLYLKSNIYNFKDLINKGRYFVFDLRGSSKAIELD